MAASRIRTAIVGTGFMGRVRCEALRRLGFVEVAAVVGRSVEKARAFAGAFGIERAEASYRPLCQPRQTRRPLRCSQRDIRRPLSNRTMSI